MAALVLRSLCPLNQLPPVLCRSVNRSYGVLQERPPPACTPATRPTCRSRPPALPSRAVPVVCCAPPQSARPPCTPRAHAPPRSCADCTGAAKVARCVGASREVTTVSGRCGDGQDRVARHLAAARDARRADYEREVAYRMPAPVNGAPPYSLGEDRVCMRATDRSEYALPCAPTPAPLCWTGRAPSPPRRVPLLSDDACRVSDGRVDPCANRVRVFREIDRVKAPAPSPTSHTQPPVPVTITQYGRMTKTVTAKSLTSRIMDGLGRGRKSPGTGTTCGDSRRDRRLHTIAAAPTGVHPEPNAVSQQSTSGGLEAALRARRELAAAGRGRVAVRCAGAWGTPVPLPAGRLELPVPSGANRVTVRVALAYALVGGAAPPASPALPPLPPRPAESCAGSPSTRRDSWLSIKTIQKRIAGCRRGADSSRGSEEASLTPPCAPKRSVANGGSSPGGRSGVEPVSPRPRPCALPRTVDPKKGSPCVDKKPTCAPNIRKCSSTLTILSNTLLLKP